MMRRNAIFAGLAVVLALAVALVATPVFAQSGPAGGSGPGGGTFGYGPGGMMGGYGPGGMMGGYGPGGMMGGYGPGGMMGGWYGQSSGGQALTLAQAVDQVKSYVANAGYQGLAVDEVMEFQYNFYAIVKEESSGRGAFELLVNKYGGAVIPEPGPNMMWNTKYGMMAGWSMGGRFGWGTPTGAESVSPEQARQLAQQWLDQNRPGDSTETPDQFYGYYTVHTLRDGQVNGMLSVNAFTGQIWYHTWHGTFVGLHEVGS
ncbi:MAG: hypothetical protein M1370_03535 [Bacteroidetes bacterium]|nr:hypothetical protein [Bacteroidota bacterium]